MTVCPAGALPNRSAGPAHAGHCPYHRVRMEPQVDLRPAGWDDGGRSATMAWSARGVCQ